MYFSKKQLYFISVFLWLICSIFCFASCSKISDAAPVTQTGFAFDTVVSLTIYDKEKRDILAECFDLCERYESLFSATREDSEVWKINHNDGKPVSVSFETASLIQSALFWCEKSNGALDLTMLPIAEEWHISNQMTQVSENPDYEYYIPDSSTLNGLLKHVNFRNVVIYDEDKEIANYDEMLSEDHSYSVQLLDADAAIDLGFIAKGYIADKLKELMCSKGIENGIISLGGNILLVGSKPDHSSFHIGIQKPFGNAGEVITTVEETDTSVVSSGCYERYFTDNASGIIYHHIFDTATGTPVKNRLLGVTIICDSSMQGDALSTYCYILGLDEGLELIRSLNGVEAVFVMEDYEVIRSF